MRFDFLGFKTLTCNLKRCVTIAHKIDGEQAALVPFQWLRRYSKVRCQWFALDSTWLFATLYYLACVSWHTLNIVDNAACCMTHPNSQIYDRIASTAVWALPKYKTKDAFILLPQECEDNACITLATTAIFLPMQDISIEQAIVSSTKERAGVRRNKSNIIDELKR